MSDSRAPPAQGRSKIPPTKSIKKKKTRPEFSVKDPNRKVYENLMEINRVLAKEVMRLRRKLDKVLAKQPVRVKRDPTDKQRKQRGEFSGKVAKAKEIYYAQEERSTEAWGEAMRKANGRDAEELPAELMDLMPDGGEDPTTALPQ